MLYVVIYSQYFYAVYMFHGDFSGEERQLLEELCHHMKLGVRFFGWVLNAAREFCFHS